MQLVICAARSYLARFGAPQTLEDLASHRCRAFRRPATRQILPWYLLIHGEIQHRHVAPTLSTNDTELESQAVLAGQMIGQISNLSAARYIRDGHLVPVLLQHITAHIGVHLYYGSGSAQPKRVRAFIDLAIERLTDTPHYVLTEKELAQAAAEKRKSIKRKRRATR